jgi:hypothetical protein
MADYYVWSGAAAGGNGTTWALAYRTFAEAITSKAAGDIFYIAHDHNELTAASLSYSVVSSYANTTKVICVDRAGSVPPVYADRRATAVIRNSGNNNVSIGNYSNGSVVFDGIIFSTVEGATANSLITLGLITGAHVRLENCKVQLKSTGSGAKIALSGPAALVELDNTSFSFGHSGQWVEMVCGVKWRNSAILSGAIVPTNFLRSATSNSCEVEFTGIDFTMFGAGTTVLLPGQQNNVAAEWLFIDCKFNPAAVLYGTLTNNYGSVVEFLRCKTAGANTEYHLLRSTGTLDVETTIVRTGGAADGTTPLSWKIITSSRCNYLLPFVARPIAVWNDTAGVPRTVTVEGIWGGGAVPNNDEVWIEAEYQNSATLPAGAFADDSKGHWMQTASPQDTSAATWGGSTTPFKLGVTFTPQQKGWVYVFVKCGKPSTTFYIDPVVTLS